jgi:hypothetical protein
MEMKKMAAWMGDLRISHMGTMLMAGAMVLGGGAASGQAASTSRRSRRAWPRS